MSLELKHPAELNPWQVYRQTKKLAKHSSRAKNADWYRSAFELDRQWHLWIDGEQMVSAVFDGRSDSWHEGPELPEFVEPPAGGVLTSLEPKEAVTELHKTLKTLLAGKGIGSKTKSLGVVLHLAAEFTLADIASEYAVDEDFEAVNELLTLDPQMALGDPNADTLGSSWRALPYWGIHDGERRSTAIQVSREHNALIAEMRSWGESNNIPVIASAVSAPLEALSLAHHFLEWWPGNGDMILFLYRKFSAFAVLGPTGDLMTMRALPHVGERKHPGRFGETLVNTAASMNLTEPRVHIVPICEEGTDELVADLGQFFANRSPMDIGVIDLNDISGVSEVPGQRLEMLLGQGVEPAIGENESPLKESDTFANLSDGWATMDFYGLSAYEQEVYPERKDLKLLKVAGIAKMVLLVATVALAGWTGFDFMRTASTAAWKLDPEDAEAAKQKLQVIAKQNSEAVYWENVMVRRSEGWLVLELLLDLFPAESGVVVTDCDYRVVGLPKEKDSKNIGFERTWSIKGFARREGVPLLSKLSSNRYLIEQFEEIAEVFDTEALRTNDETRTLSATMQQRQGQLPSTVGFPASVARHYRTAFELSIKQTFAGEDVLALTVEPPFQP